ncbi:hypothetical protein SAMN05443572_11053 [Myxococcus fulvus]|uniref:PEGA domain-containing protein n=1 Tax=Myxococcus fulvus TaxID=33 RepID=A0ABY1CRK5_MYXFU|nr:hypothetical protein [Myxococcus fulvus]SEU34430.1 hypothetical protein SAMN05443572_11053 [Myxococcus fulvus]
MARISRSRLVGIITVGFLAITFTAVSIGYFGSGTVHLLTVGNDAVELVVDDVTLEPKSHVEDHLVFDVSRGQHKVKLTDVHSGTVTHYTLEMPHGFAKVLLPTREDQCFLRFDMKNAAYGRPDDLLKNEGPRVEERYETRSEPIKLPTQTYLTFKELPERVKASDQVFLLRDTPCDFASEGTNPVLTRLILHERADELFSDPDTLLNDEFRPTAEE